MGARVVIYTYDNFSEGGLELKKALEERLGEKVGWSDRDKQVDPHLLANGRLICWGKVPLPHWNIPWSSRVYNHWKANDKKANKLVAFEYMESAKVPTVPWTTNKKTAEAWLAEGHVVLRRSKLSGDNSVGITVYKPGKSFYGNPVAASVNDAKLFTRFVPHSAEYRVHVFREHYLDGMQKKKLPDCNPYVFDQDHGLFCRDGVVIPDAAKQAACAAVKAVGLDFGAVDLLWNGKPHVLEVNTAPGLLPSEARNYARVMQKYDYV